MNAVTSTLLDRVEFYLRVQSDDELTRSDLKLAAALIFRHLNGTTGRCDPGRATLSRETGMDKSQLRRSTLKLQRRGWFRVELGGGTMTDFGPTCSYIPKFDQGAPAPPVDNEHAIPGGIHAPRSDQEAAMPPGGIQAPDQGAPVPPRTSNITSKNSLSVDAAFETFWAKYPSRGDYSNPKKPAREKFAAAVRKGADPKELIAGAEHYRDHVARTSTTEKFVAQAVTWLNQGRWEGSDSGQAKGIAPALGGIDWRARMDGWRTRRFWLLDLWGPNPDQVGCMVPGQLLAPLPPPVPMVEAAA